MNIDVYCIDTIEQFNKYFPILKNSAKRGNSVFVVGLDSEYISKSNHPKSFKKFLWIKNSFDIAVCTIQLSTDKICLIINLCKIKRLPNKLIMLLTNDCWIKVGIGIELDLKYISDNYNLGHCGGGIELKNFANLANYKHSSLSFLVQKLTNYHVKKDKSVCNWSKNILDFNELKYAAKDAYFSYLLFIKIVTPTIEYLKNVEDGGLKLNFVNYNPIKKNINSEHNYVGLLNEIAQIDGIDLPEYRTICNNSGQFKTECIFMNMKMFGYGNSKKKSKQNVAKSIYIKIK